MRIISGSDSKAGLWKTGGDRLSGQIRHQERDREGELQATAGKVVDQQLRFFVHLLILTALNPVEHWGFMLQKFPFNIK
jgi:hypothetical protein